MSYKTLDQIFWYLMFAILLIATFFALIERTRIVAVIIIILLAITFALSKIGNKRSEIKEDKYAKRRNKRDKDLR